MTTIQLAQRLARNLRHTDLATMPVAGMLEILDAINGGIQELWRGLPPKDRTTTISGVLKAPSTVAVSMTAKYAKTLETAAFTATDRGCTVRLPTDSQDNEVTGEDTVRDGFLGTSLTGDATLYHDALQIFEPIERIVSDVRLYRADGLWNTLARAEALRPGGLNATWYEAYTGSANGPRQTGRPTLYMIERVGVDQRTDSAFFFKVYPMPDADFTVRFEAELAPRSITFAQVTATAVDVPVWESLCNSVLVPLCEEQLLRSPMWADPKLAGAVQMAADRARRTLRARPGDAGLPSNRVETPFGY